MLTPLYHVILFIAMGIPLVLYRALKRPLGLDHFSRPLYLDERWRKPKTMEDYRTMMCIENEKYLRERDYNIDHLNWHFHLRRGALLLVSTLVAYAVLLLVMNELTAAAAAAAVSSVSTEAAVVAAPHTDGGVDEEVTGLVPCLSVAATGEAATRLPSDYCTVARDEWWRETGAAVPRDRHYFVDATGRLYFTGRVPPRRNLLFPDESFGRSAVALVREDLLVPLLDDLYERRGVRCVCPLFLGLRDNVSFLFRRDTWTVLYDPVVWRNTTEATLVRSRVDYATPWQHYSGDNVHHSHIVVEFSSVAAFRFDNLNERKSRTLLTGYQTLALRTQNRSALHHIETVERLRLQLSGDDAVCFTHCQRLLVADLASS